VVGWVTWRLLGRVAAVVVGGLLVVVLANFSIRWWTEWDIAFDQAQKALLEAKIVGLQDTHDELVRTGLLAKISRCGAAAKPCIRVQEPTAFGDQRDYRIIFGY
jgi:hypothetical protein